MEQLFFAAVPGALLLPWTFPGFPNRGAWCWMYGSLGPAIPMAATGSFRIVLNTCRQQVTVLVTHHTFALPLGQNILNFIWWIFSLWFNPVDYGLGRAPFWPQRWNTRTMPSWTGVDSDPSWSINVIPGLTGVKKWRCLLGWKTPGRMGTQRAAKWRMKMKPAVRAEPRGKETLILITSFGFQAHVMPESHPETFQ